MVVIGHDFFPLRLSLIATRLPVRIVGRRPKVESVDERGVDVRKRYPAVIRIPVARHDKPMHFEFGAIRLDIAL